MTGRQIDAMYHVARHAGQVVQEMWGKVSEVERQSAGSATKADFASQSLILECLFKLAPEIPVLAEEQDKEWLKDLFTRCPKIRMIFTSDAEKNLPPTYFSVDPLDGTALFCNRCPEFAVSIALVQDHKPQAGVVCMPVLGFEMVAQKGRGCMLNVRKAEPWEDRPLNRCLIGLDSCKAVDPETDQRIILPLTKAFRYARNLPSVASGIELLLRRTAAWVSTNARNWDVAATALAVEEAGGVAECLDGSPIPWSNVRMPALLFAANRRIAQEVRSIANI